MEDLDPKAISKARENYKIRYPKIAEEVDSWDDATFLNKAKVTVKGKITRAALILLGNEESDYYLSPADVKIRWILKDAENREKDYEIFSIPFLLSAEKTYSKIRNVKYQRMTGDTIFPEELLTYEPFVIREALNNCIAHQDYQKGARINVVEFEDGKLIFSNYGDFIPGSVENAVKENSPEECYRNQFLATAMLNLNMVETVGGGIRKMFEFQRQRYFPMPEYELSKNKVRVTITGKILDEEFVKALLTNLNLSLEDIIILDKVQKKKIISDMEARHLRKLNLISGRKPNYYISSEIISKSKNIDLKAQHVRQRGFDDTYYENLILNYLNQYGSATKIEINNLLFEKLPEIYNETQKKNKIKNLLSSLRRSNLIVNSGTRCKPNYVLK
ncbi:ATP-binding protein [Methanolapillus africanus]|uniref:ATP-binding protein n=1 Tax=Methanolapillus africanus TaxID=3028297 RepID=UPI0030B8F0C5